MGRAGPRAARVRPVFGPSPLWARPAGRNMGRGPCTFGDFRFRPGPGTSPAHQARGPGRAMDKFPTISAPPGTARVWWATGLARPVFHFSPWPALIPSHLFHKTLKNSNSLTSRFFLLFLIYFSIVLVIQVLILFGLSKYFHISYSKLLFSW